MFLPENKFPVAQQYAHGQMEHPNSRKINIKGELENIECLYFKFNFEQIRYRDYLPKHAVIYW